MFQYNLEVGRYGQILLVAYRNGVNVGCIERQNTRGGYSKAYRVCCRDYDRIGGYYGFTEARTIIEGKKALLDYLKSHEIIEPTERVGAKYLPEGADNEFYPTPTTLAGKMSAMVDWKRVHTALEPSAGKGDLIENISGYGGQKNWHFKMEHIKESFDVIEIDRNLQSILRDRGWRLVGDDFLSFQTQKPYDLILMNPPFSNGDEHLLKAIRMQERGGQIVCLLNAETIRNPYTNRRELLKQKLADYNARVEFVKDAFRHAQRPSDVEVAIVYIDIPKAAPKSDILEHLQKAREQKHFREAEQNALVSGDWAEQMIEQFDFEVETGIKFLEEYAALAPHLLLVSGNNDAPSIRISVGECKDVGRVDAEVISDFLRVVRLKYWRELLNREELTSKMTSAMADEYHDKIKEMQDYDFNRFNVQRVILEISSQLLQGVEDSILKLFDQFSEQYSYYPECERNIHYYNGWTTNKAHKVNYKVVIPCNGAYSYSYGGKRDEMDSYYVTRVISDMERILSYLDKGEVAFHENIAGQVRFANMMGKNKCRFSYFDATFYKKGTCHIKFHDEAKVLVDRLNIYAAQNRAWLPPCYGKKHYDNMSAEEKTVIDEFQGREEYEKVVEHPEKYIISASDSVPMLTA